MLKQVCWVVGDDAAKPVCLQWAPDSFMLLHSSESEDIQSVPAPYLSWQGRLPIPHRSANTDKLPRPCLALLSSEISPTLSASSRSASRIGKSLECLELALYLQAQSLGLVTPETPWGIEDASRGFLLLLQMMGWGSFQLGKRHAQPALAFRSEVPEASSSCSNSSGCRAKFSSTLLALSPGY